MTPLRPVALATATVLLGLTTSCGVSEPVRSNSARPGASPLAGPCWPLPDDVRLPFPFWVQGELAEQDPGRRQIRLQYFRSGAAEIRDDVDRTLTGGGFSVGDGIPPGTWYERDDVGRVRIEVDPLPGITDDAVVQGTLLLDVPALQGQPPSDCPALVSLPEHSEPARW